MAELQKQSWLEIGMPVLRRFRQTFAGGTQSCGDIPDLEVETGKISSDGAQVLAVPDGLGQIARFEKSGKRGAIAIVPKLAPADAHQVANGSQLVAETHGFLIALPVQ